MPPQGRMVVISVAARYVVVVVATVAAAATALILANVARLRWPLRLIMRPVTVLAERKLSVVQRADAYAYLHLTIVTTVH